MTDSVQVYDGDGRTDGVQVYEGEGITPAQAIQNIVNTIIKTYPDRFDTTSAEWLNKEVTNHLGRLLADWNAHVEDEEHADEQDAIYREMQAEDVAKKKQEEQAHNDAYAKDYARDMGYPK